MRLINWLSGDTMFAKNKKNKSELTRLSTAIEAVLDKVAAAQLPQDDFETTPNRVNELSLRVEQLELSNEQLREECLRHLRKASQRLKRAEEIADDNELEESTIPTAMPQLPLQAPELEDDDMSWARQQIRARGETPIS